MRSVRYSKETLGVSLSMICAATVFFERTSASQMVMMPS